MKPLETINPAPGSYQDVSPAEAMRLVEGGAARVLDVRTPREYEQLGHVPGALLLPVDLVASGPAVLSADERPLIVCCEHGERSRHAAAFLARAGLSGVLNMAGGMSRWSGPREHGPGVITGPSSWLLENLDLLPRQGPTLDVACGRGRHALLMSCAGFAVHAVDRDPERIAALRAIAERLGLTVRAEVRDLEAGAADLGQAQYDLILVFNYLHRPLFPALIRALAPGGLLLYETFTIGHAAIGKPTNPDFLLQAGELRERVAPLEVVRDREGEFEGRRIASVAARKR